MDRIRKPKKKKMKWAKKIGKPVVSMLKEKQKTMKTREKIYRKTMKAKEKIHRKAIKARKKKVEKNRLLNDEELMQFIILPLSYRTKEEKQRKVQKNVDRLLVGGCFLVCLLAALIEAKYEKKQRKN